jgi:hypothetical protein
MSRRRGVEGKSVIGTICRPNGKQLPLQPPGDTAILPTGAEVAFTVGHVGPLLFSEF